MDVKSSCNSGEECVINLASLLSGVGHNFQLLILNSLRDRRLIFISHLCLTHALVHSGCYYVLTRPYHPVLMPPEIGTKSDRCSCPHVRGWAPVIKEP